jgi:flagellar export protein FliJ
LENYARTLLARRLALDSLEAIHQLIGRDFERMRQLVAGGCAAAQAAQAQNYHRSLQKKRDDCQAALEQAERRVNAACQVMLATRQQREMVDVYRDKQYAVHQRLESREEQKILDEFAIRRVTALHARQTVSDHD